MSIAFVVVLAYGNLRGIREAGRVFAIPTYFFIFNMALLIVFGLVRETIGNLPHQPSHPDALMLGHANGGLILGVSAFFLLRAFANGSSAMTGTEAISNGVSIFRKPQARNARTTLVLMSTILGVMFLGVSVLAALTHSVPFFVGDADGRLRNRHAGLRIVPGRTGAVLFAAGRHGPDPDSRR